MPKIKDKTRISATKLQTLEGCSWRFYAQYILKAPQEDAVALVRGNIVHLVLELLTVPRHMKYYYEAISKGSTLKIKPVKKLIYKHASHGGFSNKKDLAEVDEMIMTALAYDFLCKNAVGCESEKEFKIPISDDVHVNGFIDRVLYHADGSISIRDYKTSKSKFDAKKVNRNYQAMMYALACYLETGVIPEVEFLFLRFAKKPAQKVSPYSVRQLEGFQHYLSEIAPKMKHFTEEDGVSDLASNDKERRWLCGKSKGDLNKEGKAAYICPYKYPFQYFEVVDDKGNVIESSQNISGLKNISPKFKIISKKYPGCPAWR